MTIKLTEDAYQDLVDSNTGICLSCGARRDCCEPDARKYPCEECKRDMVFGTEELMVMGQIEIVDDDEEMDDE